MKGLVFCSHPHTHPDLSPNDPPVTCPSCRKASPAVPATLCLTEIYLPPACFGLADLQHLPGTPRSPIFIIFWRGQLTLPPPGPAQRTQQLSQPAPDSSTRHWDNAGSLGTVVSQRTRLVTSNMETVVKLGKPTSLCRKLPVFLPQEVSKIMTVGCHHGDSGGPSSFLVLEPPPLWPLPGDTCPC